MIKSLEAAKLLGFKGEYASASFYKMLRGFGILQRTGKGHKVANGFSHIIDNGTVEEHYTNKYGYYLLWNIDKLNHLLEEIG